MNLFTRTLNKIFAGGNQQQLDKLKAVISAINDLEPNMQLLKDGEFKERTHILKKKCK